MDQFVAWLRERNASPLYGAFVTSFVLWNWKIFYILFWQDAGTISFPRLEYIENNLILKGNLLVNLSWILLPPMIMTFAIIEWLPLLHAWAHRVSTKHYFNRQSNYDKEKLKYARNEEKSLESLVRVTKKQAQSVEAIKKNKEKLTDEEKWEIEYDDFESNASIYKFKEIIDIIYKHEGVIEDEYGRRHTQPGVIAFSHTQGLISFIENNRNVIDLTDKGKFFAKMYFKKHPIY